jgi:choice-of-anchor B domain-containing protein
MPSFQDRPWAAVCLLALASLTTSPSFAESAADAEALARVESALESAAAASTPMDPEHLQACVGGLAAGVYPCSNVDLLEFMPHANFGTAATSVKTNSLWGWTDPVTGHEWVLLGLNNGTAFIDITDPEEPFYAGKLPTHTGTSNTWRDVRVYQNYAYVVSEQAGHGMQVFDLTQLRNVVAAPVTFAETAFYNRVSNTHTISINQDTGYAYLVGTTGTNGNPNVVTCGGNMHVVSLANPASPQFVGCYDDDDANNNRYVHENQCFVYHGPDLDCDPATPGAQACAGREICLAARGPSHRLDIIDVTNHASPVQLSSLQYNTVGYSHQAWFTEDQRYILLDDELDEQNAGNPTRTYVFDASNLNAIVPSGGNGYFDHATPAIDHNLYVRGNFVFQSNYQAGLHILALTNLAQSQLTEVGFFDLYPANNNPDFDGTWNNYPFFASGVIPVSHISQGLYLLRPTNLCTNAPAPTGLSATPNGNHRIDLAWTGSGTPGNTFTVERALGGCSGAFAPVASGLETLSYADLTASGMVTYGYRIREGDDGGFCTSAPSTCVEATTTGTCTAAPAFAGLTSATNDGQASCGITLAWGAATAYCGGPPSYAVYRGAIDTFVPSPANRIAQGVLGGTFHDPAPPPGTPAFYVVRATDSANGSEEANVVRRSATATGPAVDGTFVTGAEVGDPVLDTLVAGDGTVPESVEHAGWHLSTARFHSGARSFFSTSSSSLCVSLEAGPLTLTPGQASQLTFWTGWDVQPAFDGGIVEVSTNGGANWTRVTPTGGYPNTITNSGNACAALPSGTPAFSSSNQLTWQQKTVNLAAYAGQTVRLSWRYGSDGATNREGWYVDDVAVTHAQIPGSCILAAILADGFESGGFGAWFAVSP